MSDLFSIVLKALSEGPKTVADINSRLGGNWGKEISELLEGLAKRGLVRKEFRPSLLSDIPWSTIYHLIRRD